MDIFGTLGPACYKREILKKMFSLGMTGIRINLSHVMLSECRDKIRTIRETAAEYSVEPKILVDLHGPELRIGKTDGLIKLSEGDEVSLGAKGIPLDEKIIANIKVNDELLLDDGKILLKVISESEAFVDCHVVRAGVLSSGKNIAVVGKRIAMDTLTREDIINIQDAAELGIYGVMQPFVKNMQDLLDVRKALDEAGGKRIKIYAKIENTEGVSSIRDFFGLCDEIVIARGDLGNSMPLWELPSVQKRIAAICRENNVPFMVVTQMLSSMEHCKVPTRAEVSDIYNAVADGAASVMVTGETAKGEYPAEVIRYLANTANAAIMESE